MGRAFANKLAKASLAGSCCPEGPHPYPCAMRAFIDTSRATLHAPCILPPPNVALPACLNPRLPESVILSQLVAAYHS
eukprot:364407-Chlamydomonas_euryale.AAC.10